MDVLDAMTELVLVKGDRSKLLWANRAFREIYAMSNEDLHHLIDSEHSDPDDTVQYVKDDHHVFTTGNVLDIPSEAITHADGRVSYFHTIKSPLFNAEGKVERTVGVSRPILDPSLVQTSELHREAHKATLGELRSLIQYIPFPVAMLDVKQRFLSHSASWPGLLEYDGGPLSGHFFDDVFDTQLPLAQEIEQAITTATAVHCQALEIQNPSGRRIYCDVTIQPWWIRDGQVGGVVVHVHDVTRLKESEEALKQSYDELSQFNYRVSHDLVAPLRTIRGYLNMCLEQFAENPQLVQDLHRKMVHRVDHLSELVRDVLNLTQMGQDNHSVEAVNLNELVDGIVRLHLDELAANRMEVTATGNELVMYTERVRLQQILENLISNAVKYHDPAEKKRTLNVTWELSDGQARILVEDNGLGVDPSIEKNLFDLFMRGSAQHPGNGLGLYLVQKHVQRLGGDIVLSSPRKNTQFTVRLPQHPARIPTPHQNMDG